ncbi:MAG: hypothetical protein MJZ73_00950 [Bacteroidaceae bacterium]|nr:hypothetical protein [Bacteroidaceae bacterium]
MAEFITIDEDKFEKKTSYITTDYLGLFNFVSWSTRMKLRRIVAMPDFDEIVIDFYSHGLNNGRWLGLSEGKLIIIADDETITLPAHGNYESRDYNGNADESCYYELGKTNLLKICNSKSIAMRIYTGKGTDELANAKDFAVYCMRFYNAVYDKTAYTDAIEEAIKVKEKEDANFRLIGVISSFILFFCLIWLLQVLFG